MDCSPVRDCLTAESQGQNWRFNKNFKVGSVWHSFKKGELVPADLDKEACERGFVSIVDDEPVKESSVVEKKKEEKSESADPNSELDLNKDGKVDKKDRKLAAKLLGSKKGKAKKGDK